MKYLLVVVVVLIMLVGCSVALEESSIPKSEYEMECDRIDLTPKDNIIIRRCENKEVICYYIRSGGGVSCIKKGL